MILQEKEFQQRMQQIERLVQEIEALPDPAVRGTAVELLQATLDLHGAGLERILDVIVEAGEPGEAILDELAGDDLVRSLLLLHGLHPLDLETRVGQALDKVRPYLATHGGNVELLDVTDGVVRLRLQGSCHGCASSAVTLKLAIEEALQEVAPDMAGLSVEGVVERPPPPTGFIPLTQVRSKGAAAPAAGPAGLGRWEAVGDLATLVPDSLRALDVAGARLLFCQVSDTFYAYGATCPGCGQALEAARLVGATLTCRDCGRGYDVMRAGRCLDQPDLHLEPFPLLVERGRARVALP